MFFIFSPKVEGLTKLNFVNSWSSFSGIVMLTRQWWKNLWINNSKIVKIQMRDETNMFLTKVSDLVQNRLCLNNLKFCSDYKNIYINIIWCHWITSDAMRSHLISYNVKKYIGIYVFGIKPILNWILTIIECLNWKIQGDPWELIFFFCLLLRL